MASRLTHRNCLVRVLIFASLPFLFLANPVKGAERELVTEIDGEWIGNAISYGPYRDGQEPGAKAPSKAEMAEDLHLISKHWRLLRVYGSRHCSREMFEVIREEKLPLKVMVGAWIAPEFHGEGEARKADELAAEANRQEVAVAIALANDFPEIVWAVCVGNESQVSWSDHRVPPELLIDYLRQTRQGTSVPVTTADDFLFWEKDSSQKIAAAIDFLVVHVHPVWNGQEAANALKFVEEKFEAVQKAHPEQILVIGETGWATQKNLKGREIKYVRGKMGETEQQQVYLQITDWARNRQVPTFIFDAFDENWKGDPHPDEVEKHWGLFRADRTPKLVMQKANASP